MTRSAVKYVVLGRTIYATVDVDGYVTHIPLCETDEGFDGFVLTPDMCKRLDMRLKARGAL